jgi:hypothetical protein
MPPDRDEWSRAYAKQSRSDFAIYRLLAARGDVVACHPLHYLQMACEKIAKAYRFRDTATVDERLTTEHVAFSQFIMSFLSSAAIKQRYRGRDEQLRQIRKTARVLAREIERLAPAVDRETSPSNAEYPWEQGGRVITPCEFDFSNLSLLRAPGGRTLLRLIELAIVDFEEIRIH